MDNFIVILIAVALLNGVVGMITPEGDLRKYVRLVGSLCIIAAIVSPVYAALSDGGMDFDRILGEVEGKQDYNEIFENALAEGGRQSAEEVLCADIRQRFGISEERFGVEVSLVKEDGRYSVSGIKVKLYSSLINADPREISAYIEDKMKCECEVVYE